MAVTKKIVYSGDKFREYLNRHKITYQEASLQLGIDKNTIGKAVRGGNLNLNVLLTICNFYGLDISEFFKSEILSDKNSGGYPASVSFVRSFQDCSFCCGRGCRIYCQEWSYSGNRRTDSFER